MPQVIIGTVDHDCDGPSTSLYRFDVPPCVTRAIREGDGHAAARWINGVVHIADPTEWFDVTDLVAVSRVEIPPTAWSHFDGVDYAQLPGNPLLSAS